VEFVEEGVLEVAAVDTDEWRFRGGALRRARIAMRLQRDLELNLVGVALALDLMDEIQRLRREIRERG
jgi:chaperone modulatory protein CbpM